MICYAAAAADDDDDDYDDDDYDDDDDDDDHDDVVNKYTNQEPLRCKYEAWWMIECSKGDNVLVYQILYTRCISHRIQIWYIYIHLP